MPRGKPFPISNDASGLVQSDDPSLLKQSDKHIEGFLIEDIWAELKRGRALRCSSCRRPGACIGCSIKKCSVKGHLPCIYKTKGVAIFESEFPVFCHRHRPHQVLREWLGESDNPPTCCICLFSLVPLDTENEGPSVTCSNSPILKAFDKLDSVKIRQRRSCITSSGFSKTRRLTDNDSNLLKCDYQFPLSREEMESITNMPKWLKNHLSMLPTSHDADASLSRKSSMTVWHTMRAFARTFSDWQYSVIHGNCCRLAWMHRDCIIGYAYSAGLHHIKCPYCSNRDLFVSSIRKMGVWVPDRDAAWELEPGAFEDMAGVTVTTEDSPSIEPPRIFTSNNVGASQISIEIPFPLRNTQVSRRGRRRNQVVREISNSLSFPDKTESPLILNRMHGKLRRRSTQSASERSNMNRSSKRVNLASPLDERIPQVLDDLRPGSVNSTHNEQSDVEDEYIEYEDENALDDDQTHIINKEVKDGFSLSDSFFSSLAQSSKNTLSTFFPPVLLQKSSCNSLSADECESKNRPARSIQLILQPEKYPHPSILTATILPAPCPLSSNVLVGIENLIPGRHISEIPSQEADSMLNNDIQKMPSAQVTGQERVKRRGRPASYIGVKRTYKQSRRFDTHSSQLRLDEFVRPIYREIQECGELAATNELFRSLLIDQNCGTHAPLRRGRSSAKLSSRSGDCGGTSTYIESSAETPLIELR